MRVIDQFEDAVKQLLARLDDNEQRNSACDVLGKLSSSERPNRFREVVRNFNSHGHISNQDTVASTQSRSRRTLTKEERRDVTAALLETLTSRPGLNYQRLTELVVIKLPWFNEIQKQPEQTIRDFVGRLTKEGLIYVDGELGTESRPTVRCWLYTAKSRSADDGVPLDVRGNAHALGTVSQVKQDTEIMLAGASPEAKEEVRGVLNHHPNGDTNGTLISPATGHNNAFAGQ